MIIAAMTIHGEMPSLICIGWVTVGFSVASDVGVGVCPIGVAVGIGVAVALEGLGVAEELDCTVGVAVGVGVGINVAFGFASVQSLLMPQSLPALASGKTKNNAVSIIANVFLCCKSIK